MAAIKKRGNSYLIRVSCGYDVNGKHKEQSMTWKPDEDMTQQQIKKTGSSGGDVRGSVQQGLSEQGYQV